MKKILETRSHRILACQISCTLIPQGCFPSHIRPDLNFKVTVLLVVVFTEVDNASHLTGNTAHKIYRNIRAEGALDNSGISSQTLKPVEEQVASEESSRPPAHLTPVSWDVFVYPEYSRPSKQNVRWPASAHCCRCSRMLAVP